MIATWPDLLRLLVVPMFAVVAIADVRTRRVSSTIWIPIVIVGAIALFWDGWLAWQHGSVAWQIWTIRAGLSLGLVAPLGYLFWRVGAFGLADAKALATIAVVFPTYPTYTIGDWSLPMVESAVGVFSFTILVNAVLLGLVYPLGLAGVNLARGHVRGAMFVGMAVPSASIDRHHGRLLEGSTGFTGAGIDLDAIRMYLRWRGSTLEAVRADPDRHREPESLPAEPNAPGDGRIATDGGSIAESDDPWGARAFVEATGGPYGTRVEELRGALDLLVEKDYVWISPGIPFLLLIAVGLGVALILGSIISILGAPLGL